MTSQSEPQQSWRAASAQACGKAILLGEHFVVHGGACIAIPLRELLTRVDIEPQEGAEGLILDVPVDEAGPRAALQRALDVLELPPAHFRLRVHSSVPLGCGLGSSAAFAVALVRALVASAGRTLDDAAVNDVAFQVERLAHGNPSGVDNTVIAFESAVHFRRGQQPLPLRAAPSGGRDGKRIHLLVADTGARFSTADAVARVAAYRERHSDVFRSLLADADEVVSRGIRALERGEAAALGEAMRENHALLREVGVSSPELDTLVRAAERSGALGAKLTGAGVGGSAIAIVHKSATEPVRNALRAAGAVAVHHVEL